MCKCDNVATFHLAPGYTTFKSYQAELQWTDNDPPTAEPSTRDEDGGSVTCEPPSEHLKPREFGNVPSEVYFDLDGPQTPQQIPNYIYDEEDRESNSADSWITKVPSQIQPFTNVATTSNGKTGHTTQKVGKVSNPHVLSMRIWEGLQKAMEKQNH